jgi:hypothetical protein
MSKKLLTKKVPFQGKFLTMYSIDGITWSTRSDELQSILDRHSREQAGFSADLKGEEKEKAPQPKPKPKKFNRVHDDAEIDEAIDDDMNEEEEDVFDDAGAEEDLDLLEEAVGSKGKKAHAVKPAVAKAVVKPKAIPAAKKPVAKPATKPAAKAPQKKAPPKPAKKPAKPAAKSKPKAAPAKAKPKKKK